MSRGRQRSRQQKASPPAEPQVAAVPEPRTPLVHRLRRKDLWIPVAMALLIVAIYFPVRHYGFVDLDDPQYVSENPYVANGLTWSAIVWAFTSVHASYWIPLIWLSHMLDVQLFGLNAGGHHITNVILHTGNTVILFVLLHRMTGAVGRSAVVAGLFAVHPLHVESVVWITERKDVLSTLFLLLTLWAYVSYARQPTRWRYVLSIAWFALGLMSKAMLVTVPFMLLLLDVWPLRRVDTSRWPPTSADRLVWRALLAEKAPFLLLAIIAAVLTFLTQQRTGAVADTTQIPIAFRVANATVSYVMYVVKTVWPERLALFYPYPRTLSPFVVAACATALVGATIWAIRLVRGRPCVTIGWLWFVVTIAPVIGIVQAGDQARADRFTYVPHIGLFIAIVWGLAAVGARFRRAQSAIAVSAIAVFAVVARAQVGHWRTNTELWEHALRVGAESYVAHTSLGLALFADGHVDDAVTHFRAALRIRPDFAEAHNDLGVALAQRGERDEAIDAFLNALKAKPLQAPSHYNVAVLLAQKGDTAAALEHLEAAVRIQPNYGDALAQLERLRGRSSGR
jgi:Tfp pilus assembly protein PilF